MTNYGVLFKSGIPVSLTVKCYMRRPNTDFKKGSRVAAMLKKVTGGSVRPIRPDIDNLAKFVLDGLNGLAYHDDRQVVKLVIYKLMDNEGDCSGRTVIEVTEYADSGSGIGN